MLLGRQLEAQRLRITMGKGDLETYCEALETYVRWVNSQSWFPENVKDAPCNPIRTRPRSMSHASDSVKDEHEKPASTFCQRRAREEEALRKFCNEIAAGRDLKLPSADIIIWSLLIRNPADGPNALEEGWYPHREQLSLQQTLAYYGRYAVQIKDGSHFQLCRSAFETLLFGGACSVALLAQYSSNEVDPGMREFFRDNFTKTTLKSYRKGALWALRTIIRADGASAWGGQGISTFFSCQ